MLLQHPSEACLFYPVSAHYGKLFLHLHERVLCWLSPHPWLLLSPWSACHVRYLCHCLYKLCCNRVTRRSYMTLQRHSSRSLCCLGLCSVVWLVWPAHRRLWTGLEEITQILMNMMLEMCICANQVIIMANGLVDSLNTIMLASLLCMDKRGRTPNIPISGFDNFICFNLMSYYVE